MNNTGLFSSFCLILVTGLVLGVASPAARSNESSINDKSEIDKQEEPNLGETFSKTGLELPIIIRNRQFAIPFTVPTDSQVVPTEIELLYSNNGGQTWYSFARVPTTSPRKEFFFRADQDGDYLFLLRTWFKNNESRVSQPQRIRIVTTSNAADESKGTDVPGVTESQAAGSKRASENNAREQAGQPEVIQEGEPETEVNNEKEATLPLAAPATASVNALPPLETKSDSTIAEPKPLQEVVDKEAVTDASPEQSQASEEQESATLLFELPEGVDDLEEATSTGTVAQKPVIAPGAPSPLAPTPTDSAASEEQASRVKKLLELAKSNASRPSTAVTRVPAGSTATDSADTAESADIIRPGQIKSIALGHTPGGEPTVMVRWVRPGDITQTGSQGGLLRIERSNSPNGPWTTVAEGLESDRNGYWWRATQFDAVPFYLRTVCLDSYGKEWTDVTTQEINLSQALAGRILPSESGMSTGAGELALSPETKTDKEVVRAWQTPPVPEGVEDSEKQYLSGEGSFKNASMERASQGGTTMSAVPGATQVEKTAAVNKTETAFNYEPQPNPAVRGQNGRWQTDPGRLTLNPLFTEGFGSLFQSRRPQQSSGSAASGGQGMPVQSGEQRWFFSAGGKSTGGTSAVPPQSYENGYNGGYDSNMPANGAPVGGGSGYMDNGMGTGSESGIPGNLPGEGEVIYLDEHGNRIANPFAAGGPFAGAPQQYAEMGYGMPGNGGMSAYPSGQGVPYYNGAEYNGMEMAPYGGPGMAMPGGNVPDESNWKPGATSGNRFPGP
ncbi:MAG: hypothetical protein Q4G68_01465 [Planctomycetia bacterium]|nr:hypothetical protein [Planctomycetia bacterium]